MKCSIIVACYNNTDLIKETLNSIDQQTYQEWEVILVDDASTDNTVEVLRQYISSNLLQERYKLVSLPRNCGVSYVKGVGVQRSEGDIIVICDHDDALTPNALEEIVNIHKKYPNASIVYSQHYNCDHLLKPTVIAPSGQVIHSDILEDKISHLLTYKRSFYDNTSGYDSFFKIADDKDIIYKLEEVGDVVFLEKPLYYFRISSRGASQGFENFNKSRDEKLIAVQNAIVRREKTLSRQISPSIFINFLAEHYLLQAEGYLLMNKPLNKKFIVSIFKSFYYRPGLNLKRKVKAALLLTRIKRNVIRLLGKV